MEPEGWYEDPYGLHTDRWYSNGRPTALVRDEGAESRDEPPTEPLLSADVPAQGPPPQGGDDLKRADSATRGDQSVEPGQVAREVLDGSGALGVGFS